MIKVGVRPQRQQEANLMQSPADNASGALLSSESFRDDLPSISANNSVITQSTTSSKSESIILSNNVLSISVDTKGADIIAAKAAEILSKQKRTG